MLNKFPYILTVFAMFGGVLIALMFGANEEFFKNRIKAGLAENVKISAITDDSVREATIKSEIEKNWRYYQRYHFHATGISAMTMGMLLLLSFVSAPTKLRQAAAWMVAVGGFLYPIVWLLAGIFGPMMGRSEAKDTFELFAFGGGVFFIGIILTLILVIRYPLRLNFAAKA